MDKFKFASLVMIGTLPIDALDLSWVSVSPFHSALDHKCKSLKYWEVVEKLENTCYKIKGVESLGGYQERYTLDKEGLEIKLDGYHKGSGHFVDPFRVVNN